MAAGKSGGSTGEINFLEALTRSESKRDGGVKNNWSFDHGEESEGDTDKDEANLLSVDEDEDSETSKGKKLNRQSEIVATCSGDSWKICARRNKTENSKPLKGNPVGLNMSSNKKKLRKEYPPHVQKLESNPIRLSRPQGIDHMMKKTEESESHLESEIKRKVSQKRHSAYQSTPLSPASKKCLTDLEDLQRNCRQAISLNESTGPLLRTSNHQNSGGQKSQNTALTPKKFYGNSVGKVPIDIIVNCGDRQNYLQTNGKVVLPRAKGAKTTNLKERKTNLSDLNDPIILSSDDDDDDSDRINRRESISPQPADSACSSPAPSTGKVEAALNENTCRGDHELRSIPADSELNTAPLPRKARMKDQKRRKVISHEPSVDPVPVSCQNSFGSIILPCRSIRVGTLFRMLTEPVIFCLDFIKIQLEEPENDPVGITLNTSDLTKCEWCNARKLPVVFLQTIPAVYQRLSMQLQLNMDDKVWSSCKGINRLTSAPGI